MSARNLDAMDRDELVAVTLARASTRVREYAHIRIHCIDARLKGDIARAIMLEACLESLYSEMNRREQW